MFDKENLTCRYTPLGSAVLFNSKPYIDLLLEYGADLNKPPTSTSKRTALQSAVELGRTDMIPYLVGKGADVNVPPAPLAGFTALQLAAKAGFTPIAEYLIEQGAQVNAPRARIHGRTAFEAATEYGRLDMMLLLVRSGADLVSHFGEKQFERAIKFATARRETPAVELAHELREKILQARAEVEQELSPSPLFDFDMS
ncbi:Protein fem-1-like protein [Paraphaeosphaeria sporulosa]